MIDAIIVAVTAVIGLGSSGLLAAAESRLRPARTERSERMVQRGLVAGRSRPFALPWIVTLVVGALSVVVLVVVGDPSQASVDGGKYTDLFATSAQISAALLIALAVEARARNDLLHAGSEAVEATVCISLGVIAAVTGLMPSMPAAVYGVALTIIPGSIIGGMVAVGVIAVSSGSHRARVVDSPSETPEMK